MPAHTKQELLNVTNKEYKKLKTLINSIEPNTAIQKYEDDTSIKDIIGHRAHWIELFLGWYTDGQAGKTVYFPAEGYKWNELKAYNASIRAKQSNISWLDITNLLEINYQKLCAFIDQHSNSELYIGSMKGAKNNWTVGRWAEAAGPSHFRSACKYIKAVLKAL